MDEQTRHTGREEQNLERLAEKTVSAIELANKVASSSEETAELFSSRWEEQKPWKKTPRPDQV